MATTKHASKRLALEVMTNREVLRELTRIYGDLLERLGTYAEVLDADHADRDELLDAEDAVEEFDSIYDEALGLISRIEKVIYQFEHGNGSLRARDGACWNWGIHTYKRKFEERAVAGMEDDDG